MWQKIIRLSNLYYKLLKIIDRHIKNTLLLGYMRSSLVSKFVSTIYPDLLILYKCSKIMKGDYAYEKENYN